MPLAALLLSGPGASAQDDRAALRQFAASGVVSSRTLQQDLARSSWPPQQLRAALSRAYGIRLTQASRYLDSPAGVELLQRHLSWWSPDLAPQLRLAALRAAILADSRDGSLSLLGVLERVPVRFALAADGVPEAGRCGCPEACGRSALAHLAFLMACLQGGATAGPAR